MNFDTEQELVPLPKDKIEVYEIAIPKKTIASILEGYTLVVVENKNDEHFNAALGNDGFLFLPAQNSIEVFLTVKQDNNKFGLRDRDYLRSDEILKIQEKLPHLRILSYYSFENYVYHPENIFQLQPNGYDKEEYIADIVEQKNKKILDIVGEIGTSRNHYIEFKDCIKNDGNIKPIIESLQNNVFDEFYPFFSMKNHYNKKYISKLELSPSVLSSTEWFRKEMLRILRVSQPENKEK